MKKEEFVKLVRQIVKEELKNELLIKAIITEMILEGNLVQHLVEQVVRGSDGGVVTERMQERSSEETLQEIVGAQKINSQTRFQAHLHAATGKRGSAHTDDSHGSDDLANLEERFQKKQEFPKPENKIAKTSDLASRDPDRQAMLESEGVPLGAILALMNK